MTLEETAPLMTSEDYKERFRAEYWQLKNRVDKLREFLYNNKNGNGKHQQMLSLQYDCMTDYLLVLKARANEEGIKLD